MAVDLRPQSLRRRHVGDDAALGGEKATFGLHEREVLGGEMVAGVASPELGAGENLMREIVELAGLPGSLEDPGVSGPASTEPVVYRSCSPAALCISRHSS